MSKYKNTNNNTTIYSRYAYHGMITTHIGIVIAKRREGDSLQDTIDKFLLFRRFLFGDGMFP
jgi:hypothetical protein